MNNTPAQRAGAGSGRCYLSLLQAEALPDLKEDFLVLVCAQLLRLLVEHIKRSLPLARPVCSDVISVFPERPEQPGVLRHACLPTEHGSRVVRCEVNSPLCLEYGAFLLSLKKGNEQSSLADNRGGRRREHRTPTLSLVCCLISIITFPRFHNHAEHAGDGRSLVRDVVLLCVPDALLHQLLK